MTQQELTLLNLGDNLDSLSNLDPRGYGVCRILYPAARELMGAPLSTNAAQKLCQTVKPGDLVFIITGFVLLPFKKAEMDGIVGSVLLARALVLALGAKPVVICPQDCLEAVKALCAVVGLHLYTGIEDVLEYPISMAVLTFTKCEEEAAELADSIIGKGTPAAVISVEAPGANCVGKYHNATGLDVTELEAKTDILFEKLKDMGVLNIAIGDLGNEIGMGAIAGQLKEYVPYAAANECRCGCGEGIAARTSADNIITATVSDWGCYALIAAIAFLKRDIDIMHTSQMEADALTAASRNGMVDMYGWMIPAIDGFGMQMNMALVNLMRECVMSAIRLEKTCETWFNKVIEKGFYTQ